MNGLFWILFAGMFTGLILFAGLFTAITVNFLSGFLLKKAGVYTHLMEWMNLLGKISWRNYFETNLRAETGKPLDRPYGSRRGILSFNKLQFNPVYLGKTPLNPDVDVNTEVIIGPRAQKPLHLKIPIFLGGMAYGSGYSLAAKIALAKAATMTGIAANSGNGPFVPEERFYADKYILQFPRGFWSRDESILKQADMIVIALGHSARGSAPVRVNGKKITKEVADKYGTIPGLDVLMEARLPEVETGSQWEELIRYLKEVTGGVPIGVKFGASQYLEKEMEIFCGGGADVLIFDGTEGGTHGGMPLFMDDMGLPTLPALCRAARFIRDHDLHDKISLVVGGGLVTPGDFAKCLALGANAVLLGTITALTQSHTQTTKTVPWEPPTGLLYNDSKEKNKYDPDLGAKHLYYYFRSCVEEMKFLAMSLGKNNLNEFNRSDLVALDPLFAQMAEVEYAGNGVDS